MNPYKMRMQQAPPFEPLWMRLEREPDHLNLIWQLSTWTVLAWLGDRFWRQVQRAVTELDKKSNARTAISESEWDEFNETGKWLADLLSAAITKRSDDESVRELLSNVQERDHGLRVLRQIASRIPSKELQYLARLSFLDCGRNFSSFGIQPLDWRGKLRSEDGHWFWWSFRQPI